VDFTGRFVAEKGHRKGKGKKKRDGGKRLAPSEKVCGLEPVTYSRRMKVSEQVSIVHQKY